LADVAGYAFLIAAELGVDLLWETYQKLLWETHRNPAFLAFKEQEAVSAYVMHERPHDTMSPILFLVGGNGPRRHEALSYAALVRLFARASDRAGIRTPWVTPHALRHTHATRMWETAPASWGRQGAALISWLSLSIKRETCRCR
jgi:integrase